ncbi:hypothetical protein JW933_10830 [candidate division FCPU426 bacterium]|nr:hypothetical protein [candidate division FCPU426 bacterium]
MGTKTAVKIICRLLALVFLAACQAPQPTQQRPHANVGRMAARHVLLGNAYYDQGRKADAMREWGMAWEMDPTLEYLPDRMQKVKDGGTIETLLSEGGRGQAEAGTQHRIQQELKMAEHYYRQSKCKQAEMAWQRVLVLCPEDATATSGLKRLADEQYQGQIEGEFDHLVRESYERGMQHFRCQEWKEAEAELAKAEKLAPLQPQVKKHLMIVRLALQEEKDSGKADTLRQEAKQAENEEDWLKAFSLWEKISNLDPNAEDVQAALEKTASQLHILAAASIQAGQKALQLQQYSPALAHFNRALQYQPGQAEAMAGARQARAALASGNIKKADEQKARRHFDQGGLFYRQGQWHAAIDEWNQAVILNPGQEDYAYWLERAKQEEAKHMAQQCALAKTRYQDGLQAFQREDLLAALAAFKDVMELCPQGDEAAKANKHIVRIKELMK